MIDVKCHLDYALFICINHYYDTRGIAIQRDMYMLISNFFVVKHVIFNIEYNIFIHFHQVYLPFSGFSY